MKTSAYFVITIPESRETRRFLKEIFIKDFADLK